MSESNTSYTSLMEKTAEYVEALEVENEQLREKLSSLRKDEVEKVATSLTETLSGLIGEDVEESLVQKLAMTDDEDVRKLVVKLAERHSPDTIGSATKRRSPRQRLSELNNSKTAGEQSFLNFLMS